MKAKEIIAQYGLTGTVNGIAIGQRRVEIAGLEEMVNEAMSDAYLRGQQDFRERAVKACDEIKHDWSFDMWGPAIECADAVNTLPILPLDESKP